MRSAWPEGPRDPRTGLPGAGAQGITGGVRGAPVTSSGEGPGRGWSFSKARSHPPAPGCPAGSAAGRTLGAWEGPQRAWGRGGRACLGVCEDLGPPWLRGVRSHGQNGAHEPWPHPGLSLVPPRSPPRGPSPQPLTQAGSRAVPPGSCPGAPPRCSCRPDRPRWLRAAPTRAHLPAPQRRPPRAQHRLPQPPLPASVLQSLRRSMAKVVL